MSCSVCFIFALRSLYGALNSIPLHKTCPTLKSGRVVGSATASARYSAFATILTPVPKSITPKDSTRQQMLCRVSHTVVRKLSISIVGAFVKWRTSYALHACGAPRKRRCARARLMEQRASGVRGVRYAPLAACAWRSSPRTAPI